MPAPPKEPTLQLLSRAPVKDDEAQFWVVQGEELQAYTSGDLLRAFEHGDLDGGTLVRIKPTAPSKPLRSYIREMVWLAYQSATGSDENENEQIGFQAAFEHAPIGIVLSDLTGLIQETNSAFSSMLGYSGADLIGRRVGSISETTDRPREVALGNEVLAGIRRSFEIEKRFRHRDGSLVETLLSISMLRRQDGTPFQVVAHVLDLTRRKRLERELAQADRLKSIGKLAGGIAHDFNNILQVFTGGLPLLSEIAGEDKHQMLDEMKVAATSGARLTRQIMAFSKQGVVQVEVVELNQLLTNLQPMIKTALGDTSRVVLNLSPHPLFISANTMQLEQAVMNLAFNAAKAMKNGGTFTIHTNAFSDDRVLLQLEDTGTGMDTETIERAFEPYFSTHTGSEGAGLGLAMVHGIVTRFGGSIALESTQGQGTTCSVLWPQYQPSAPEVQPETSPDSVQSVRTLVVDDELPILRMVSRILQRTGHTISTADSVRSAVDLIEQTPEDHDLLVCDVCLKDGNGTAVMKAARLRWPDIAVLYISGFTGTMLKQHDLSPGTHNFLAKPFRPKDLIASTKTLIQHRALAASKNS